MGTLAISETLLDTLKRAFEREGARLCRDAARILKVPEKELTRTVMNSNQPLKLKIFDDDDIPQTCPVIIQTSLILERCRGPCLMGTGRCLRHQMAAAPPELPETVQSLTRLERSDPADPPMWCDEATGTVFDTSGKIIGEFKQGILEIFEFCEEDETTD